jgi:serine/threonine-protein kinase RsbW
MPEATGTVTEIFIPSDPNYLSRLRTIVGRLATCAGMDLREVHEAKLAVSEACANAIRHGSPLGQDDRISIKLHFGSNTVVAEITDRGTGFDPSTYRPELRTTPGGYGIPLMKALTDQVEFEKNGKGMTVRLVKRAKRQLKTRRPRMSR